MKAAVIFTGSSPILIVTSYQSITDPQLLKRLGERAIHKFIAFEVPIERAKERYGERFHTEMHDREESDGLRVIDDDGQSVFLRFHLNELGPPIMHDGAAAKAGG